MRLHKLRSLPYASWGKSSGFRISSIYDFLLDIILKLRMAFTRHMGLRGGKLRVAMLVLIVIPSFLLFGYNNGSTGGILTLESFVKVSLISPSPRIF